MILRKIPASEQLSEALGVLLRRYCIRDRFQLLIGKRSCGRSGFVGLGFQFILLRQIGVCEIERDRIMKHAV